MQFKSTCARGTGPFSPSTRLLQYGGGGVATAVTKRVIQPLRQNGAKNELRAVRPRGEQVRREFRESTTWSPMSGGHEDGMGRCSRREPSIVSTDSQELQPRTAYLEFALRVNRYAESLVALTLLAESLDGGLRNKCTMPW